jgi:hypothetical protein
VRVIGLDFGTTTGFAWTDTGQADPHNSGEWKLENRGFDGAGMRFLRFEARVKDLILAPGGPDFMDCAEPPPIAIFYESAPPRRPGQATGTAATRLFGGFMAVTMRLCEERGIPYAGVTVSAVKKTATGKGNAAKELLAIAALERWKVRIPAEENNRVDALWILQTGLDDLHPEGWAP